MIVDVSDCQADLLKPFAQVVGSASVRSDASTLLQYGRSTQPSAHAPRGVLYPHSVPEIQALVRVASQHHVQLHPISRGCNWGYGDACAPGSGHVILDLGRMDRIIEVNERLGYAVIEPGVTQGQLADYLAEHHPDLWMDVTGAGRGASIVGNVLERGFGHTRYGDHMQTTCGMQIVLADGRILETGYGHYDHARAKEVYRYGIGPSLDGLFMQSSMGVVTRMGIWLMRRPEAFSTFFFTTPDEAALADLVERLAPLRMQGLLQSAIHIGNDLRLMSARMRYPWDRAGGVTPLPQDLRRQLRHELVLGAWAGCGAIYGTPGTVKATQREVKRALRGHKVFILNDRRRRLANRLVNMLNAVGLGESLKKDLRLAESAYDLLKGQPTDEHLRGAGWRVRGEMPDEPCDPRDIHAGLIWAAPVLPMTGEDAQRVVALLEPIYHRHGFDMLATFTMISERAMICVTNIAFDRRDTAETAKAAACYKELSEAMTDSGYLPYRTAPQGFAKLAEGSSVFWDVVREIKQTLDPGGVISPPRYMPPQV